MKFLNNGHLEKFKTLLNEDNTHPRDCERQSLFYIISGNEDLFQKRKHLYNFKDNCVKLNCLTDGSVDLSSSAGALVRLGFNLYNNYEDKHTNPLDIFYNLDSDNYNLAMESINIRFNREAEKELNNENEEEVEEDYEP
ncbi:DUF6075 family protein [Clostridium cellulovorans]|uniref:Uncharacterized protein n=1 Tax=Clostridium cellulovorans (strain ATCC 35296 / DSM 3052 / OCM 3 / 743B) TaxID=573061 RepID=D9SPS8_CLOC7|nr:DUF6075 family protein [Clostridium cellulovorans]ADL52064.1 hypothetical protein Clocel_2346 [Clostridium cellulovorans 743B]